ncbi:peptidyl-prolyl cis-trans isomerase [Sulfurimonas sp.]|jgi:peptidyl-prolyl cis-trans isomerase SurA|uniref:peptidyl-prolyl cis-trans isomerase n=1 Tax=Sulfurimonas sp. TaxID=2022749 RepID=UPI0026015B83|nr:peptidyl-prolyl cis-trans isomerase [Sulfurimonas sp.]MBT5935880.1 peptidyl-prolyl cis-trans isomerase [Sulfurimonas sp.]
MYKYLLFLFTSSLLLANVYDGVSIVVKNSAITLLDIQKEMKNSKVDEKTASDILIRKKLEDSEIKERKITVSSAEVFADVKTMAAKNNLSVSALYDAIRESNGMNSQAIKEKIKQKLLSQKLYSAIAYSSVSQPSMKEVEDYFQIHKSEFTHPASFDVTFYNAKDKGSLQAKIDNPMFYSQEIVSMDKKLNFSEITPQLASLLEKTPPNTFTQILPNGEGGFMSIYINEIATQEEASIESVKDQIMNQLVSQKREQVLSEYFARLRHNADINIIRKVK